MLNNLESLGFIYRETSETDKRSVKVYLTELGREKRRIAKDVVRNFNQYLADNFSENERDQLIASLAKLNELATSYKEEVVV
jgi:DNA-binding MarR family transcriptional regulator